MIHAVGNISLGSSAKRWGPTLLKGANCKGLISSDSTDGNQVFTDTLGHSITAVGDVQHDTAQKKFGATSILFDGTGDYLSIADSEDWDFGSGPFTIDMWVRWNDIVTEDTQHLISQMDEVGVSGWLLYYSFYLHYWVMSAVGGSDVINLTTNGVYCIPSAGVWYHVALIRGWNNDSSSLALTYNGTALKVVSVSTTTMPNVNAPLLIGAAKQTVGVAYNLFNGWIDEIRIVKGTAMWTSNFIPPSGPYI